MFDNHRRRSRVLSPALLITVAPTLAQNAHITKYASGILSVIDAMSNRVNTIDELANTKAH